MRRTLLPAALVALVLLAGEARADRQTAEFFHGRGEKSLQEKDWAGAEQHFQRSLKEDESYLPARYGLAQSLLGAGRTEPGLAALRAFAEGVRADPAASAEWKALLAKAEKQLKDLDVAGTEVQKIVDRYAADLAAFSRKWAAKDPSTAAKAARRAAELRPGDPEAAALLGKVLGDGKGESVVLFDGRDASRWTSIQPPVWQVTDGMLIGESAEGGYYTRSLDAFEGEFDLRGEVRIFEEKKANPMAVLSAAVKGDYDQYSLGLLNRKIQVMDNTGENDSRRVAVVPASDFKGSLDVDGWNSFELRFRKDSITALVNGVEVCKDPRPAARTGGYIGMTVQNCRAGFRNIVVEKR